MMSSSPAIRRGVPVNSATPKGRRAAVELYGDPSDGERAMGRRMLVARALPGRWNKGSGRLYIHKLAEPHLRAALNACAVAGVLCELKTLGCYNRRRIRGRDGGPWSYHASGVAVDLNHATNPARYLETGTPEPFGDAWRMLWPTGLSAELVACWEGAGWTWGGRWGVGESGRVFADPMHFQLVR